MKRVFIFLGIILAYSACTVSPQKIEYGKDMCSYCDMAIVEKTHAAQYVTEKGRAYKFDAIECMINDINDKPDLKLAFTLVTDYNIPAKLIDASSAIFLISEEIKSPMGANLTAFGDSKEITQKGKQFNWKEIKEHFNKK